MRITEGMALRDFLRDLRGVQEQMLDAQNRVSTGRRLLRPSDGPRDASDLLRLKAEAVEAEQYARTLDFARSRLEFTDTALEGLQTLVERVRFLGLSALGTLGESDAYAVEVDGLADQILNAANATFEGRYIFGGTDTENPPFVKDAGGAVYYNGNSTPVVLQVERGTRLETTVSGDVLFGAGNDVFQAVAELAAAMRSGVQADIDARLKDVEAAWEGLSVSRSRVGGMINAADSVASRGTALTLAREDAMAGLANADLAEALTEFQSYENALQSTLAIGARISQLTLLDYLR